MHESGSDATANFEEFVPFRLRRQIGQNVGRPGITLSQSFRVFCSDFLGHLAERYKLQLATIWSVDPVRSQLILLASAGVDVKDLKEPTLDYFTDMRGVALESKETTTVDNVQNLQEDGRVYSDRELIGWLGLKTMVSVPVVNTCNSNQVLLVMNLYPSEPRDNTDVVRFSQYGDWLASRYETFLHDHCVRFANRLSIRISKMKTRHPKNIYREVVWLLNQVIDADSIGIYVEREDASAVECRSFVGHHFTEGDTSQLDELATGCWQKNREFLIVSRAKVKVTSRGELLPLPQIRERIQSEVFVPLRDPAGRAKGVFCCVRTTKYPDRQAVSSFTYEDVAVIEAIAQAFTPQLEILLADYQRTNSMNKLAHELRVPVVAFRAALERVERECRTEGYTFKFDHFGELRTYHGVMSRLLLELDAVRKGPHLIPLVPERIHIFSEIIAPAKRFLQPLFLRRGLTNRSIVYKDLRETPSFYLDPGLMTQVVFNLLDNAIKYSKDKSAEVKIEIEGKDAKDNYEVLFRDNGIGVPNGWEEKIFDQTVRGPNAYEYDVAGDGLGLWFAREITRRHGGDLVLQSAGNPTTFAVILPNSLRDEPPRYTRRRSD